MLRALTIEQFSQETGISPQTVRRQIRLGQLPAARVGRRYFVPIDWLDRIVREPFRLVERTEHTAPSPTEAAEREREKAAIGTGTPGDE